MDGQPLLTAMQPHHCDDGVTLGRPEFNDTIFDYWFEAWSIANENSTIPTGDFPVAENALQQGIALIGATPACNALERQYKDDLMEMLSWYLADVECSEQYSLVYLSGSGMNLEAIAVFSTCRSYPKNRMIYYDQKASVDGIPSSQSTCDPEYTEPPLYLLPGEVYANLAGLAYQVYKTGRTIKKIHDDLPFNTSKWIAGLALVDAIKNGGGGGFGGGGGGGGGGAGGTFGVDFIAHSGTDLVMISGSATSEDLSQPLLVNLSGNSTNITTLAALHHAVPVTIVGTYTLDGWAPVTVTFPNTGDFDWPYDVGATLHPVDTFNLVDTQSSDPAKNNGGRLTALTARSFQVAGVGGIPSSARAVTGNLTVKSQSAAGWLALTRSSATPTVSNLNFPASDVRANGVSVQLDKDGKLWIYYGAVAGAQTDFVFDVTGYFVQGDWAVPEVAGQGLQNLVAPYRLVDTRGATGSQDLGGRLTAGQPKSFQVTGLGSPYPNIPAEATAVAGNLTVTGQTAAGSISLTNSSGAPAVQTLHFPTGDNRAVGVTVKLDPQGKLWLNYNAAGGATTHAIFDITGYYIADGALFYPVDPVRTVDTRGQAPGAQTLGGRLTARSPKSFLVAGFANVPAIGQPGQPSAATGNLTVTQQTAAGWLALTNVSTTPTVSTLNFPVGDNRANIATVQLGALGKLWIYYGAVTGATTHVIYDLSGFYSGSTSY